MAKPDLSRIVFLVSAALLALGLAFVFGLYSALSQNMFYRIVARALSDAETLIDTAEQPPEFPFLQPGRGQGEGVTVNRAGDDALVLMAGFFDGGNQIRLIERDGTVLAKWKLRYTELFPDTGFLLEPPVSDFNTDIHGVVIEPDGAVAFNFEYAGMAKLSRCGETLWTLKHPTHHSVERAGDGGYWVPGQMQFRAAEMPDFPPFTEIRPPRIYREDLILKVSADGRIETEVSVPKLLYDNGLEALMTANGLGFTSSAAFWDGELVHLNKIGPLSPALADAFALFEAGDLVLSLRQYNLIFVVDPDSWRIKWHQTGPWLRQHDPEFNPDGTITVFNNNTYRSRLMAGDRADPAAPRISDILRVDPLSGRTEIAYGGRDGQRFLSHIRGKHDPRPGGGFLITEFEAGRVFETDATGGIVWEYVNAHDAEHVAEITEARVLGRDYFTVSDWRCE